MSFSSYAIESGVNATKPEPAPAPEKPTSPAPVPGGMLPDPGEVSLTDDDDNDAPETTQPVAGTDEDDDGSSGAPAEAEPPEGWVPPSPEGYQPPEIEGGWNQQALSPVLAAAHEHGVSQEAVAAALSAYAEQAAERQAEIRRLDKERMAEVRGKLTPAERTAVDAAASVMSPELRASIRQARLPDGRLLLHDPEFLSLIANLNKRGTSNTTPVTRAQDDAQREREIRAVMRQNFDAYRRSSMPAELSAIMRRRGAE
jgi:hypothetical protein